MKLSKKATTALSFTIGACLFVSTAFADSLLGSGYDRLKGSMKHTASQMEKGLNSYTVETLATLKDNGQPLLQISAVSKIDMEKKAQENSSKTQYSNGEATGHYSYSDSKVSIWKNGTDDKYYVTEFPDNAVNGRPEPFSSPFNEQGAPEIEKIVDAVAGNLKDYVQAEERTDGGMSYSGSLSEAQVPAVVNAVASFGVKKMIGDQIRIENNTTQLPKLESDIFVKKVTGTALENKSGILENMTGDVVLAGKDKNGAMHELTLSVALKLSGVGSTAVAKPDLNGADVEKVSQSGGFSSKYVGTYKNSIVIEKNGKFVKIGERVLEITSVESDKVTGRFYETVKPGFESDYPDKYDFHFEYNPDRSKPMAAFTYTNSKGEQEQGELNLGSTGKIYINLNIEMMGDSSYRSNTKPNFEGDLTRVFEE